MFRLKRVKHARCVLLGDPAASVVLYGKPDIRPGRKMGHVNRLRGRD